MAEHPLDTDGERALWAAVLRTAVVDALAGDEACPRVEHGASSGPASRDARACLADLTRLGPVCEALGLEPQWVQAQLRQQHPALFTPVPPAAPPSTAPAQLLADWHQRLGWLARQCWAPGRHGLCLEDLVQEGVIGLLDAMTKYDSARDTTFASYAEFRITGAMRDAMRKADPTSRSVREHAQAMAQAARTASQQLGRAPERAEVAGVLGMAPDKYDQWQCGIRQLHTLSLDYDYAPEHFGLTPDDKKPSGVASLYMFLAAPQTERGDPYLLARVRTAVAQLPWHARRVLRLYYEEDLTMKTIGARLGLTESRVSQIHTRAVALLQRRLAPLDGAPWMPVQGRPGQASGAALPLDAGPEPALDGAPVQAWVWDWLTVENDQWLTL